MLGFKEYLEEASLGRILQHVESGNAIISLTAFRGDKSLQENRARNKKLENIIRKAGYGYNKIIGHYVEEEHGEVTEESYFVVDNRNDPERLKKFAIGACKLFDQDAIFFRTPEGDNTLVFQNGSVDKLGTGFSVGKMGMFYSKIKGKPYVFESSEEYVNPVSGMAGAMLRSKYNTLLDENDEYTALSKFFDGLGDTEQSIDESVQGKRLKDKFIVYFDKDGDVASYKDDKPFDVSSLKHAEEWAKDVAEEIEDDVYIYERKFIVTEKKQPTTFKNEKHCLIYTDGGLFEAEDMKEAVEWAIEAVENGEKEVPVYSVVQKVGYTPRKKSRR